VSSSLEHEPVASEELSSFEYKKSEELVCVSDNPVPVCMHVAMIHTDSYTIKHAYTI